jgi:rhamnose transport system ATP-binding protein
MSRPVLELAGVSKSFGGTRALIDAGLVLYPAEVCALLGENGAGKSTLVKILTGVQQPDGGRLLVDGRNARISSPQDAARLGISVIHQESVVFDDLSVAENIFIASPPTRYRLIDWRLMRRRAAALLAELESGIDPRRPLRELSIAQKHLVQIARALSCDARIMIMDEPTASLSQHEAADLLHIVQGMRDGGRAVLFISHKFDEVFAVADRYAVFRDGRSVGAGLLRDTNRDALVALMVGRALEDFPKTPARIGPEMLRAENLSRRGEFAALDFGVSAGEILGIYGLVGAGRSEAMRALFGVTRFSGGRVVLDGKPVHFSQPDDAVRAGVAFLPEDRQGQGVILSRSISSNIALAGLRRFGRCGFLARRRQDAAANQWVLRLQIKCDGVDQEVQYLSGGNQQKVALAKWLLTAPRVLILDEPTKGIDVGAKATVHRLIGELAAQGVAVILVSSELPEIMGLADRILVMRRGRLRAEFARRAARAEDILRAASDA